MNNKTAKPITSNSKEFTIMQYLEICKRKFLLNSFKYFELAFMKNLELLKFLPICISQKRMINL